MQLRNLIKNRSGDMGAVLAAVVTACVLAISIVVVWNIMGAIDASDADTEINDNVFGNASSTNIKYAQNSTDSITENLETFYSIIPIVLIVISAVAIMGYLLVLRQR